MNEMLAILPVSAKSDNNLFLAHFILRLPVSMRNPLEAKDKKMAAEMAKHADTLWDARVSNFSITAIAAPIDVVSQWSPNCSDNHCTYLGCKDNRCCLPCRALTRGWPQRSQMPGPSEASAHLLFATTIVTSGIKHTGARPHVAGWKT
jgi:hypothetical protein